MADIDISGNLERKAVQAALARRKEKAEKDAAFAEEVERRRREPGIYAPLHEMFPKRAPKPMYQSPEEFKRMMQMQKGLHVGRMTPQQSHLAMTKYAQGLHTGDMEGYNEFLATQDAALLADLAVGGVGAVQLGRAGLRGAGQMMRQSVRPLGQAADAITSGGRLGAARRALGEMDEAGMSPRSMSDLDIDRMQGIDPEADAALFERARMADEAEESARAYEAEFGESPVDEPRTLADHLGEDMSDVQYADPDEVMKRYPNARAVTPDELEEILKTTDGPDLPPLEPDVVDDAPRSMSDMDIDERAATDAAEDARRFDEAEQADRAAQTQAEMETEFDPMREEDLGDTDPDFYTRGFGAPGSGREMSPEEIARRKEYFESGNAHLDSWGVPIDPDDLYIQEEINTAWNALDNEAARRGIYRGGFPGDVAEYDALAEEMGLDLNIMSVEDPERFGSPIVDQAKWSKFDKAAVERNIAEEANQMPDVRDVARNAFAKQDAAADLYRELSALTDATDDELYELGFNINNNTGYIELDPGVDPDDIRDMINAIDAGDDDFARRISDKIRSDARPEDGVRFGDEATPEELMERRDLVNQLRQVRDEAESEIGDMASLHSPDADEYADAYYDQHMREYVAEAEEAIVRAEELEDELRRQLSMGDEAMDHSRVNDIEEELAAIKKRFLPDRPTDEYGRPPYNEYDHDEQLYQAQLREEIDRGGGNFYEVEDEIANQELARQADEEAMDRRALEREVNEDALEPGDPEFDELQADKWGEDTGDWKDENPIIEDIKIMLQHDLYEAMVGRGMDHDQAYHFAKDLIDDGREQVDNYLRMLDNPDVSNSEIYHGYYEVPEYGRGPLRHQPELHRLQGEIESIIAGSGADADEAADIAADIVERHYDGGEPVDLQGIVNRLESGEVHYDDIVQEMYPAPEGPAVLGRANLENIARRAIAEKKGTPFKNRTSGRKRIPGSRTVRRGGGPATGLAGLQGDGEAKKD